MKINTKITGYEQKQTKDARKAEFYCFTTADGTKYNVFENKLCEALKNLVDVPIELTVAKKGEFTNIIGVQELEESLEIDTKPKENVVPNSKGTQNGYNISYGKDIFIALLAKMELKDVSKTSMEELKNKLTQISVDVVKQLNEELG